MLYLFLQVNDYYCILMLFFRLEHGVYNLSRMREAMTKRYKGFQMPWEWMLETGFVSQVFSVL